MQKVLIIIYNKSIKSLRALQIRVLQIYFPKLKRTKCYYDDSQVISLIKDPVRDRPATTSHAHDPTVLLSINVQKSNAPQPEDYEHLIRKKWLKSLVVTSSVLEK